MTDPRRYKYPLQLPASLKDTAARLAREDGVSLNQWIVAAVAQKIKGILGEIPVYLSFDIDGLDPAFAPGTGTPVWGGLSSIQAQIILRDIAGINIKGGDVVEVSPPYDTSGATAIAGAHVATQIICLLGWNKLQP